MKRYGVNVRETGLNHEKNIAIYKPRGIHKAFNKGGITLLVECSKSPQIKKSCK